jgi:hypothetical protein
LWAEGGFVWCARQRSDKLKLRPFTLGKLRNCLAEDEFLEMLGLLVCGERRFRREYFIEEELLRFRYALMDLKFLHTLFLPRLGKKLPQQTCNGILFARFGFPKCGNDKTLVGTSRSHRLSPSKLTLHSPSVGDRGEHGTPLGLDAPVRTEPTRPSIGRGSDLALAGHFGRNIQKAASLSMPAVLGMFRRGVRNGVCALAPQRQAA